MNQVKASDAVWLATAARISEDAEHAAWAMYQAIPIWRVRQKERAYARYLFRCETADKYDRAYRQALHAT